MILLILKNKDGYRLEGLKTEWQARLEILLQNRKDLQTQVARIKQIIEKVLDQNASLAFDVSLSGKLLLL